MRGLPAMQQTSANPAISRQLDRVGVEDRVELREWQNRKHQLSREILCYGDLVMIPAAILRLIVLADNHRESRAVASILMQS
jgi:hypothetical protein